MLPWELLLERAFEVLLLLGQQRQQERRVLLAAPLDGIQPPRRGRARTRPGQAGAVLACAVSHWRGRHDGLPSAPVELQRKVRQLRRGGKKATPVRAGLQLTLINSMT